MDEIKRGTLRVFAKRAGTVTELVNLLQDIETAYNKILSFSLLLGIFTNEERLWHWRRFWRELWEWGELWKLGVLPSLWMLWRSYPPFEPFLEILPEHKLEITRVQIASPGFWEFLGALNPLQQIREYLNDRHRRRQDREYREQAERERLMLENEMIRRQIWEKENSVFRERIQILKEIGFSDEEIRRLIWFYVSQPLIVLGRHQDTGLIETAKLIENDE